ncbi:MAG: hypothetical protein AB1861_24400 [Cyanobacteriota bacterium]
MPTSIYFSFFSILPIDRLVAKKKAQWLQKMGQVPSKPFKAS